MSFFFFKFSYSQSNVIFNFVSLFIPLYNYAFHIYIYNYMYINVYIYIYSNECARVIINFFFMYAHKIQKNFLNDWKEFINIFNNHFDFNLKI